MEEIREVKLPKDSELLKSFLMKDSIEFMPLISNLREERFPQAYAGISESSIKTLVTVEKGITIWKKESLNGILTASWNSVPIIAHALGFQSF